MIRNPTLLRSLMYVVVLICLGTIRGSAATPDKNLVFSNLRELPDLGACPPNGAQADPNLKRALETAVAQAQAQAKDAADTAARMKDADLIAPEVLKQLKDLADRLDIALKDPDVCVALFQLLLPHQCRPPQRQV